MSDFEIIEYTDKLLKGKISSCKLISDDFVDRLFDKYNVKNINIYPTNFTSTELEKIRLIINKYKTMKIAFYQERDQLVFPNQADVSDIVLQEATTVEGGQLLNNSINESYKSTLNFLSSEKRETFRDVLFMALPNGQLWKAVMIDRDLPLGLLLIRDFHVDGIESTLVSWVWIDEAISLEIRTRIHYLFISKMREAKNDRIVASIENLNIRSIKFFKKLGFRPLCLFFQK